MLYCSFIVRVYPYENIWINRLEAVNETATLFAIYFLYIFSGLTPEITITYKASLWLNNFLYAMLGLNFATAIVMTISQIMYQMKLKALIEEKKKLRHNEKNLISF